MDGEKPRPVHGPTAGAIGHICPVSPGFARITSAHILSPREIEYLNS